MLDESRQMRDQKMKWRFMISGRVCALFMLVAFSSVIMGTDFTIIGHKPALACCYDPPEPVIEPDPVAPSAPASDSQEEAAAPADSAAQSMVNAPQDKEESNALPVNLYAPVLRICPSSDKRWAMVKGSGNCLSGARKAGACP